MTSPLVAQTARDLDIRIPCSLLAQTPADASTVVLATMPPTAPRAKPLGLVVTAGAERVDVSIRNQVPARAPRADLDKCRELHIWANSTDTGARFVGPRPGRDHRSGVAAAGRGLFTALSTAQVTGAQGRMPRGSSSTTGSTPHRRSSWLVMVVGILAAIAALVAVWMLDRIHGYHRRFARSVSRVRALIPTPVDGAVGFVLVAWHFLGGGTADDGYILNMGRDAQHTGVLANYYRYYGSPEAPFDWYFSFLSHWSEVSTAGVWMRLPALAAGLLELAAAEPGAVAPAGPHRPAFAVGDAHRCGRVPGVLAADVFGAAPGTDHRRRHPADLVGRRGERGEQAGAAGGAGRPDRAGRRWPPPRRASSRSRCCSPVPGR